MKKWLIFLCLLLSGLTVSAHQPDVSSTMLIHQGGNKWVLQIRASLTAFQHAIAVNFPGSAYASPAEFQAMAARHLQENIDIRFNGDGAVALQNGQVQIGHETTVVFEVAGAPENMYAIVVKNSSFKDIHRHQSALIVFKKGLPREQFILNEANQHMASLALEGNQLKLRPAGATSQARVPGHPLAWAGLAALALGIAAFSWAKSKKKALNWQPLNQ